MNRPSCLLLLLVLAAPSPALAQHDMGAAAPAPKPLPLYTDLGTWHHAIKTKSTRAQKYFDQGLRMVYAFNHDEAIAAFAEAEKIDSTCAMAPWGIALAYGPNINLPIDPDREKAAYAAIERAEAKSAWATPAERAYIGALSKRYAENGDGDRKKLNESYADAMRIVAQNHPNDPDAQVLFAEAMMNLRPWDHWTHDGKPQPGTLEIVSTLERTLRKWPNHPGANHYYIHTMEASPNPERALASADRLPSLMPGAGHIVHMPAHIYERTGRYEDGVKANEKAIKVDEAYIAARDPQGVYPLMYYNHNIHFLWAGLEDVGKSREAIARAREVSGRITPDLVAMMPMAEFIPPTAYYAYARFGMWDSLLALPKPPELMRYTNGMWHYARGLALAAKGRIDDAAVERDSVDEIADKIPDDLVVGINAAKPILRVAASLLAGDIAYRDKKYDDAIKQYEDAVRKFDDLKYDEPPAWYQPPRLFLGKALLDAGKPVEAEKVYREDLVHHPNLGWTLYGLWQALDAQGKTREAALTKAEFDKAWLNADVKLTSSRF